MLSIMCNILQPLLDIIIPIMTGIPEMKSDHLHQRCPVRKNVVYIIGIHGWVQNPLQNKSLKIILTQYKIHYLSIHFEVIGTLFANWVLFRISGKQDASDEQNQYPKLLLTKKRNFEWTVQKIRNLDGVNCNLTQLTTWSKLYSLSGVAWRGVAQRSIVLALGFTSISGGGVPAAFVAWVRIKSVWCFPRASSGQFQPSVASLYIRRVPAHVLMVVPCSAFSVVALVGFVVFPLPPLTIQGTWGLSQCFFSFSIELTVQCDGCLIWGLR